jgi:hypothetical protein
MPYWLTRVWWAYVLNDSQADSGYGNWFSRAWCRAQGHPAGVWFYNAGGTEPNMHCKGCGEDLA